MGVISPIFPLYADQEFQVTRIQIGLAVGLLGVGRIFTSLPAGYLARMVLVLGHRRHSAGGRSPWGDVVRAGVRRSTNQRDWILAPVVEPVVRYDN